MTQATRTLLAALGTLAVVTIAACADEPAAPAGPAGAGEAGAEHIHGLGVNPADDALFIATHTGLFRAAAGERRARRVGGRRQDTMGFTIVGPDRFLGSGHPDASENLPPLLGLIGSDDAGETWEPISLLGEADFHILRTSGSRIYGVDAGSGRLMLSDDGGRTWAERTTPELIDLAADPRDPDHLLVSSEDGFYRSRDAGKRWRPVGAAPPGLLAWSKAGLFLVDATGGVHASRDAGRTWTAVGETGGRPAAFTVAGSDLYVALHSHEVKFSGDGGRTWQARVAAP